MSPINSKSKKVSKKKTTLNSEIEEKTIDSNTHSAIPTPPIIKINRKYSRLSLNSSYESLPESRSCSSAANTTLSRSRSISEHSNLSNQSRASSTTESTRNQLISSSLSDGSNLKIDKKSKKNRKLAKKTSFKHKNKTFKNSGNMIKTKNFDLESGGEDRDDEDDDEGDEIERGGREEDEHDSENDPDEMLSISQLEKLTKHELILDDDDYDHIKQQFANISWGNQFKVAMNANNQTGLMMEKDQIGFWLAKNPANHSNNNHSNNGAKHHHHHHHHHYYSHTKSHFHSHSQIASNTFKNFNDWRSHLMYYKQVKGYNHSVPTYFKGVNMNEKSRPANNLPIIEKYSNNDQTKFLSNENPKISFSNMNSFNSSYLISQSGVFQNNPNTNSTNKLNSQSTSKLENGAQNDSPQNSNINMASNVKRIKNIDFKIDSNMRRLLEANQPISSQRLMPTTRLNKSIAGPLRLLPKDATKPQQQQQFQLPPHLLNKLISSTNTNNMNSNNSNNNTPPNAATNTAENNFVLNMTSLEEKFVKEFSNKNSSATLNAHQVNNPISEPGKRVIAFYHRVNENDYSAKMQDYALNTKSNSNQENNSQQSSSFHNHDLVRWSKLTRPTLPANLASIISNAKSPITTSNATASVNAQISNSLVHKKFNNLSNIQNRLQAQHQQLILHQQLNTAELNRNDEKVNFHLNDNSNSKTDSTNATASSSTVNTASSTANPISSNVNNPSTTNNSNSNSGDVLITATTSNGNSTTRFANFLNQPVKFQIAN